MSPDPRNEVRRPKNPVASGTASNGDRTGNARGLASALDRRIGPGSALRVYCAKFGDAASKKQGLIDRVESLQKGLTIVRSDLERPDPIAQANPLLFQIYRKDRVGGRFQQRPDPDDIVRGELNRYEAIGDTISAKNGVEAGSDRGPKAVLRERPNRVLAA